MNTTYVRGTKLKEHFFFLSEGKTEGEKASPSKPGEGTEVALGLQGSNKLGVDDVTLKQLLRKGRLCIPACLFQVFVLVVPPLHFPRGMCKWRCSRIFLLQPPQHCESATALVGPSWWKSLCWGSWIGNSVASPGL